MYSIQWQYGRDSAHQDCELHTFRLRRERNLPAKAATLSPRKIVKSSLLETDIYCMHSGSFGHLSFKNVGFENVLKKMYFSNKARSTIQHTFTKEKRIPGQKGAPGPPPKSALGQHELGVVYNNSVDINIAIFISA